MNRYTQFLSFYIKNIFNKSILVDGKNNVVVSLTSYDPRISRVFATIESIAEGTIKPKRLILYLDNSFKQNKIPETIKRLERRGLEIIFCHDDGPHKKYRPYLLSQNTHTCPLVTADDDVLYPKNWLNDLLYAHEINSKIIYCHRARIFKQIDLEVAPYRTWAPCKNTEAGRDVFSLGVSGVIYPASFLNQLIALSSLNTFCDIAPNADDIWLNMLARFWGYKKQQIRNEPAEFAQIPLSSSSALHHKNVAQGGNDLQMKKMTAFLNTVQEAN
jgi:hypothetical protein